MPDPSLPPTTYLTLLNALAETKSFSTSPTAERTVAYCVELANLRIDFDRMDDSLFRYWGAIDTMEDDHSALGLMLKKFLVVYTEDNTVLRVHAYRERVFQLINAILGLGFSEEKPQIIDGVTQKLGERGDLALLRHLECLTVNKPPAIRDALDRRNKFVHRLPTREWLSLRSGAQLQDWLDFDWETETFQSKDPPYVQLEADNLKRRRNLVLDIIKVVGREFDAFEERFCALLYETYCRGVAG